MGKGREGGNEGEGGGKKYQPSKDLCGPCDGRAVIPG